MLQPRSIQSSLGIRDKILSLDYILIISILVLGVTSMFAMYSTDGGEFKYHTNSHILRFFVFFGMFFVVSFISIRFWHETSCVIEVTKKMLIDQLVCPSSRGLAAPDRGDDWAVKQANVITDVLEYVRESNDELRSSSHYWYKKYKEAA